MEVAKFSDQIENVMLSNHQSGTVLKFVSNMAQECAKNDPQSSASSTNVTHLRLRKLPNKLSNTKFWTFLATRKIVGDMLSRLGYGAGSGPKVKKYGVPETKPTWWDNGKCPWSDFTGVANRPASVDKSKQWGETLFEILCYGYNHEVGTDMVDNFIHSPVMEKWDQKAWNLNATDAFPAEDKLVSIELAASFIQDNPEQTGSFGDFPQVTTPQDKSWTNPSCLSAEEELVSIEPAESSTPMPIASFGDFPQVANPSCPEEYNLGPYNNSRDSWTETNEDGSMFTVLPTCPENGHKMYQLLPENAYR